MKRKRTKNLDIQKEAKVINEAYFIYLYKIKRMKKTKHSDVFHAKTKLIDISDGEELIALINEQEAMEYGISPMDKISVMYK